MDHQGGDKELGELESSESKVEEESGEGEREVVGNYYGGEKAVEEAALRGGGYGGVKDLSVWTVVEPKTAGLRWTNLAFNPVTLRPAIPPRW